VVLDFTEGRTVPFPSVAPESRVLTMRTEPQAIIRLEQDGADNFYATLVGGGAAVAVRATFVMDAPRDYFGAELPDAPVDALAPRVRPLPSAVLSDAQTFAAELALSRRSSFAEALRALTAHFRAFEESADPPRDSGNIYLDLARGMRGICRHRVYGFVITAHALGMHARFVQNEAHAWAEVELPGAGGWLRVDLGGAATGLDARGNDDEPFYRPDVPDRLPRPAAYERAYEEARRMSEARGRDSEGTPREGAGGDAAGDVPSARAATPALATPGRRPLELALDRRAYEVFRGRELEVTGVARGGGSEDVDGLRVEVLLRAPRAGTESLLGVTVTRDGGRFRAVLGVPPDLLVGDYRLIVRSPGNATLAPAEAR
jgi:transglutaminase-like putative cysteine protease